MKSLLVSILFFTTAWAGAGTTTTKLRYEGELSGGSLAGATLTSQQFQATIERTDGCGGNLGLTAWSSGTVTITNGKFIITPEFNSDILASAMNPNNTFGSCAVPNSDRRLVIKWFNGSTWESFGVAMNDSPRAAYASVADNAQGLGSLPVQPNMSCSTGTFLKYDTGKWNCASLDAGDIMSGTLSSSQVPSMTGDVTGSISTNTVVGLRGFGISTLAPSSGQVLKYNGTQWEPAADNSGTVVSDATYTSKGVIQVNSSAATSGLDLTSGVLSMTNVISAGSVGASNQIPVLTYDAKGRITAASFVAPDDASKLSLSGGTMSGAINMNNQNITGAASLASTNVSTRNVILADNDTDTITLKAPTNATATYSLTLPPTAGTNGYILSTNGSGVLSWVSPSSGSISSVSSANTDISVASGATAPVLTLNAGTGANQIVKLDGSSRLPAVDGSQVTALNPANLSAAVPPSKGGTGLSSIGTANQILGVNSGATGLEYKTISAGSGVTISHAANGITINATGTGGTVTNVTSANSYLTVTTGNSTPTITANVGTVANTLAAGNDSRIINAVQQSAYSSDVSPVTSCLGTEKPYWNTVSDAWACTAITGFVTTSTGFAQNGNSFGAPAILGTNDAQPLRLRVNGAAAMTLDTNMNVGIGATTTPSDVRLNVQVTDATSYLQIVNTDSSSGRFPALRAVNFKGTNSFGHPRLVLQNSRGSAGAQQGILGGDTLGDIQAWGSSDTNPNNNQTSGRISFQATENFSSTASGGSITFLTTHNGTINPQQRMIIDHNGHVGIGSFSPNGALDIVSNTGEAAIMDLSSSDATGFSSASRINMNVGYNPTYSIMTNDSQTFQILDTRITDTSRLLIDNTGNVGIGTTTPGYKMDVNGDLRAGNVQLRNLAGISTVTSASNLNIYPGTSGSLELRNSDSTVTLRMNSTGVKILGSSSYGGASGLKGLGICSGSNGTTITASSTSPSTFAITGCSGLNTNLIVSCTPATAPASATCFWRSQATDATTITVTILNTGTSQTCFNASTTWRCLIAD